MARRITAAEGPTPSDPREIFDKHMGIIGPLKKDSDDRHDAYRKAHSSYRSALKLAKNDGVDLDALTDVLKIAKEDRADVERRFRNTNNYLVWLGVPIGTQLGMDLSGETVAQVVAQEKVDGRKPANVDGQEPLDSSPAMLARAYNEGNLAGNSSKFLTDCPYTAPVNEKLQGQWQKGWTDAQADIAAGKAPPKKVVSRGSTAERKSGTRKKRTVSDASLALQ